jgi:hypothetical protein
MKYLIIALFISTNVFSKSFSQFQKNSNQIKYIVKKGDTLSHILYNHGFDDIYKSQSRQKSPLYKAMWKNGFSKKDLRYLKIGQAIYLPALTKGSRSIASIMEDIPDKEIKKIVIEYAKENK